MFRVHTILVMELFGEQIGIERRETVNRNNKRKNLLHFAISRFDLIGQRLLIT